ncbi:hypothetical protein WOLCODRAFT_159084 [Wolfiporia cocos MD-104 SS10]|uniref:Uncharacterized protein n=1 Tax=Wolfiporia cocos (strain MD-104) TaxID=742152 RepID=A0A2H3JB71_WOLCO|nr:hypothetical protein WOLCODRAFT_159084 [Wolfiporia cocos MD-104 SS10]
MSLAGIHYVLYNIQPTPGMPRLCHSSLPLQAMMIYILNPLIYPSQNFRPELHLTAKLTSSIYPRAECFDGNPSDNSYLPSEDQFHEPCVTGNRQQIYFIGAILEHYREARDPQRRAEDSGHRTYRLSNQPKVQQDTLTYLYSVRSMNNLYKVFSFCCPFRERPITHPTWTRTHANTLRLEHLSADLPADFQFGLDEKNIQIQPVVPPMTREQDKSDPPDPALDEEEHGGLDH